ncbi:ferredoxin [Nonomuraea muscovyensis]|uniref:Ferredoxin n=1 Tax=Nonomuraea muscovyensis TaxID=1124761 RepID=A0A7X0EZ09_9ACTN|nr:ferredoxin [Nonomuraea muscovyensis]MBB6349293.1 ferredoxin [Nonomuraea muscovyensis]
MRVHVDMTLCQTHAQCVFAAPDVFALDGDDVLTYEAAPDDALTGEVELAARACPVQAITLHHD